MQAAGVTADLPALARAAAAVPIELPLIVADYGSSQGRNALRPMQIAIEGLRAREPSAPITVVHIDQPGNDFSSLFAVLNSSPESYLQLHAETYAAAVGHFILRSRAAAIQRHAGLRSSFAVIWLTSTPPEAFGQCIRRACAPGSTSALARARSGGLATLPHGPRRRTTARRAPCGPRAGAGRTGVFEHAAGDPDACPRPAEARGRRDALRGRVQASIRPDPAARMAAELRAPFAEGAVAGLVLEEQEDWPDFPDLAWERYRQDGDLETLTEAYLGFVQATFLPSLLDSLEPFSSTLERSRS